MYKLRMAGEGLRLTTGNSGSEPWKMKSGKAKSIGIGVGVDSGVEVAVGGGVCVEVAVTGGVVGATVAVTDTIGVSSGVTKVGIATSAGRQATKKKMVRKSRVNNFMVIRSSSLLGIGLT
jgi:hypothetical protein